MRFEQYAEYFHAKDLSGVIPDYEHDLKYLLCEQKKARFMLQDGSRNHLNTAELDENDRNTRLYYLQEIEKEIRKISLLINQLTH